MARNFMCTKTDPVVETKAGKLRGFQLDGTYVFHGVKYADAKRFHQPTPVEPWEGIKNALAYGYVCPMLQQDQPSNELMVPHRYWPLDENCQYLNIWTQHLDPNAKKPVLVWLHGGGFAAGSSIEHIAYEGENMSKYGDVVVISLNHRLNILGYLDLSPFGEEYKNSGNAGNADMVAALQWIHENIANFGGDPENVTLFGQSGGGMKVWTLMQTPAADGLFHKGVVQSGCIDHFVSGNSTEQNGKAIVTALLAGTNLLTKDKIAEQSALEAEQSRKVVLSDADSFEEADGYYIGKANNETVGYVFQTEAKGYGGAVKVMTGISADGQITGVVILEHSETPGLGANAEKASFTDQFKQTAPEKGITLVKNKAPSDGEIEAMTGASITSRAVTNAVNEAITKYNTVKEGA